MFCMGLAITASAGCSRPPLGEICPNVAEGDLVITEIRGPQTGGDNRGQWFEVYNASEETVDMRGLRIEFFNLQGARTLAERPILVRSEEFFVEPGAYATLGHHEPNSVPEFVDYSFIVDYFTGAENPDTADIGFGDEIERRPRDLLDAGRIDLSACGVLIDRLRYTELPPQGSLSFDGDLEPDAEANDDLNNFCTDDAEEVLEPGEPQMFIGLPGTPQEENAPCVK